MKSVRLDVVGLNHRLSEDRQVYLQRLVRGKPLRCELEREPDNEHDENAIKVLVNDLIVQEEKFHIGYIRRGTAAVLAQGLDRGTLKVTRCRLIEVEAEYGWGRVQVRFSENPANKREIHS